LQQLLQPSSSVSAIRDHLHLCAFLSCMNLRTTTDIYTLSLHDALPISSNDKLTTTQKETCAVISMRDAAALMAREKQISYEDARSEEHTSELQSRFDLVCRLLLEKKKLTGGQCNCSLIQSVRHIRVTRR